MAARPLDGVRVLDMSRLLPGPFATLMLSDLGAEVTKLEAPAGGDYLRYFPPLLSDGNGAAFHALNRGKHSIALDIKSAQGREDFLALIADFDVVLESFRPGVLERLDLAPKTLHHHNPELIICRLSGFGQAGPDRLVAGHDLNYVAKAGLLGAMRTPQPLPLQAADMAGGAWPAALQIVSALYQRDARRGNTAASGCVIDVSMTDSVADLAFLPRTEALFGANIDNGEHLLAGGVPCYDVYPTADGALAVGALEPKFWSAFCVAVDLEEFIPHGHDRGDAGQKVRDALTARLAERTARQWMQHLRDVDCCVERVLTPGEAAGATVSVTLDSDEITLPAPALAMGRPRTTPAPALGSGAPAIRSREP